MYCKRFDITQTQPLIEYHNPPCYVYNYEDQSHLCKVTLPIVWLQFTALIHHMMFVRETKHMYVFPQPLYLHLIGFRHQAIDTCPVSTL